MSLNVDTSTSTSKSSNSDSTGSSSGSKTSVDYNSFLRLLVAELKNQDPTQPMDSTQYMAQIASFSNVEQAVQTNSKLDQLLQASSFSQAADLIGKTVTSDDKTVSGVVASVRVTSDGLVAVLASGKEITMGAGVTIAQTAS